MGNFFGLGRDKPLPSQYGEHQTPVTHDVVLAGWITAFIIIYASFLVILPGYSGRKGLNVAMRITFDLYVGLSIILGLFGQEWEVGRITNVPTPYKPGTGKEIHADIGLHIGFLNGGRLFTLLFTGAFAAWILMNILMRMVVRRGAQFMVLTGSLMILSNIIWISTRNFTELAIPFGDSEDHILRTHFGFHFWNCLNAGVQSFLAGISLYFLDQKYPHLTTDFFEVDPLLEYEEALVRRSIRTGAKEQTDQRISEIPGDWQKQRFFAERHGIKIRNVDNKTEIIEKIQPSNHKETSHKNQVPEPPSWHPGLSHHQCYSLIIVAILYYLHGVLASRSMYMKFETWGGILPTITLSTAICFSGWARAADSMLHNSLALKVGQAPEITYVIAFSGFNKIQTQLHKQDRDTAKGGKQRGLQWADSRLFDSLADPKKKRGTQAERQQAAAFANFKAHKHSSQLGLTGLEIEQVFGSCFNRMLELHRFGPRHMVEHFPVTKGTVKEVSNLPVPHEEQRCTEAIGKVIHGHYAVSVLQLSIPCY
ncbi:unnamed protein product [Notodromas monacha]|uniref:Uncharacterized protein n=1 Tax=Notodromas monacha TaxID=399045 RepID=A0A7R9BK41_9CRUS|nr:unnamed protein product [Notodromas monacha]CAG0915449.1 unnamed protein product [Notodromas monacha]